jgi:hypothetical protein
MGSATQEEVGAVCSGVLHENSSRLKSREPDKARRLFRRFLAWSPSCHKVPGTTRLAASGAVTLPSWPSRIRTAEHAPVRAATGRRRCRGSRGRCASPRPRTRMVGRPTAASPSAPTTNGQTERSRSTPRFAEASRTWMPRDSRRRPALQSRELRCSESRDPRETKRNRGQARGLTLVQPVVRPETLS